MGYFDTFVLAIKRKLMSWIADDVVQHDRSKRTAIASCKNVLEKRVAQLEQLKCENAPETILRRIREDITAFKKHLKWLQKK